MEEILLLAVAEKEITKAVKNREIKLPEDLFFRESLYLGFVVKDRLTKISKIKSLNFFSNDQLTDYHFIVNFKQPVNLAEPLSLNREDDQSLNYITFENMLGRLYNPQKTAKSKRREFSEKEKDILYNRYLEHSVALISRKNYAEAASFLVKSLDLRPEIPVPLFYLGNINLERGKLGLAVYYFLKCLELEDGFIPALNNLAQAFQLLNKLNFAEIVLNRALKISPDEIKILFSLGKLYLFDKQFEKAEKIFEQIISQEPDDYLSLNFAGVVKANLGKLSEAVECWEKLVNQGEGDEVLLLNLARAYGELGRIRDSVGIYEAIMEKNDEQSEIYQTAEKAMAELVKVESSRRIETPQQLTAFIRKNYDIEVVGLANLDSEVNIYRFVQYIEEFEVESLNLQKIIFKKFPKISGSKNQTPFNVNLDKGLITINRTLITSTRALRTVFSKALDTYEDQLDQAIEQDGGFSVKTIDITEEADSEERARVIEALQSALESINQEPTNEWAYYAAGSHYAQLGQYLEAEKYFARSLEINSENSLAYYAMGLCNIQLGNLERAITSFKQAIITKPDSGMLRLYDEWNYSDAMPYFGLGDAYIRSSMFSEAIEAFKKGLSIDATSALAHFQLGTCYEILERYSEAIDSYTNAISLSDKFFYAYAKLGIVYYKLNKFDEALLMLLKSAAFPEADSEVFFFLAETYRSLDNYEDSQAAYQLAIEKRFAANDPYAQRAEEILADWN